MNIFSFNTMTVYDSEHRITDILNFMAGRTLI